MAEIEIYDKTSLFYPFQPEAPMTETLEWLTDVINSHNGTEYRYRVRNAPRQSFSVSCPIPQRFNQLANNIAYAGPGTKNWAVPVWSESQRISSVLASDETLEVETLYRDFREGGWVMLWESPEKWRPVRILEISPGMLTLDAPVGLLFNTPWVFPLNSGRLSSEINRVTDGYRTLAKFRQIVSNNLVINSELPEQFLGNDIYYDESFMSGNSIEERITTRVDIVDFDTGPVAQFTPWTHKRRSRPYRRVMDGLSEVYTFKEWLHRRAGRQRAFWLPTFEHDLFLDMASAIVGNSLLIRVDQYVNLTPERTHIAIQTRDGAWYPRTVIGVTGSGAFRTVVLDTEILVDSKDITRVCFLGLHRLDTDRVQLQWIGGGVCVSEIRILELSP